MSAPLSKIEFNQSNGRPTSLSAYTGNVVLVVNVASKCGLTPQYDALEKIYEKYQGQGFTVLGFPANEFAGQEPGTNAEIQEFCKLNFGVKFPVFEKMVVKGKGQHPLYQALTTLKPTAVKNADGSFEKKLSDHGLLSGEPNEIKWNFEKFLLNRKGEVVQRFAPDITPNDTRITQAIENELKTETR